MPIVISCLFPVAKSVRGFIGILTSALALSIFSQAGLSSEIEVDSLDEYWTLKQFEELHPKQKQTADPFSRRVAAPGQTLPNPGKSVKIAFIYPGQEVSDYWRRSVVSVEARLEEIGLAYDIKTYFSALNSSVGEQSKLVAKALKDDPDYLVFTLDVPAHKHVAQRLIARGRPKVILQNITTPVRAWRDRQPFLYVGFDHVVGTKLLIDHYKQELGAGKSFAILYGPRGYVSRARGNTFLQAYLDPEAENLKASYYVGYNRERSRNAASRILTENPEIAFIYSCSSDIALGALEAIRANDRKEEVITNGWGGGSAELAAIAAGDLDVTVMRMNDDNGVAIAEAIALDQSGRADEIPTVFSGAFELVTKGDTQDRIDTLKTRAFRYSK